MEGKERRVKEIMEGQRNREGGKNILLGK